MFKLLQFYNSQCKRYFSSVKDIFITQCLKERTLLRVTGDDVHAFLQGLITNDMEHLRSGAASMFSLFLNSSGRVRYDSIIYNTGESNFFLVECDSDSVGDLKNHLTVFKVRRKVNITYGQDKLNIWTLVNKKNFINPSEVFDYTNILDAIKQELPGLIATVDPRMPFLGLRIIAPANVCLFEELEKILGIPVVEENYYKLLRYKLGVGEGLFELPYEKCFPMEINGDYLHGISFHKGCYLGQELTARTYHTGVIRKRLMPLSFEEEMIINEDRIPIFAVPQSESNKPIGKLLGVKDTVGLGLLRIYEALKANELMVFNQKCKTQRPFWWPTELPKKKVTTET